MYRVTVYDGSVLLEVFRREAALVDNSESRIGLALARSRGEIRTGCLFSVNIRIGVVSLRQRLLKKYMDGGKAIALKTGSNFLEKRDVCIDRVRSRHSYSILFG